MSQDIPAWHLAKSHNDLILVLVLCHRRQSPRNQKEYLNHVYNLDIKVLYADKALMAGLGDGSLLTKLCSEGKTA